MSLLLPLITSTAVGCTYVSARGPLVPHHTDNGDHAGLSVNDRPIWYATLAGAERVKA